MMVAYSFVSFLLLFVLIGLMSVRKKKYNTDDYHLASRSIPAWMAGLSAGSTTASGAMMLGGTGLIYLKGFSMLWVFFGFLAGAIFSIPFVGYKLAKFSKQNSCSSISEVITKGAGNDYKYLRYLIGISIFIFLGTYASAQILSGGKSLNLMFGLDFNLGALIISSIILMYCMAGGIRASIWTDVAQAFVMIGASLILLITGVQTVGGFSSLFEMLNIIDPAFLSLSTNGLLGGTLLFFMGWLFAGFLDIGQPHIMVRFMTLKDSKFFKQSYSYHILFYISILIISVLNACLARAILPTVAGFDFEMALPALADLILHPILVGAFMAAIFAAILSTADSLILSVSSSLTKDIFPRYSNSYLASKVMTFLTTTLAFSVVVLGSKSIFNIAVFSRNAIGAIIAPLLLINLFGYQMKQRLSVLMASSALLTVIMWRLFPISKSINEAFPALIIVSMVFIIGKSLGWAPKIKDM